MSSENADGLADVVPDDFLDTWGASTYEEALARAEQAPTTTPDELAGEVEAAREERPDVEERDREGATEEEPA